MQNVVPCRKITAESSKKTRLFVAKQWSAPKCCNARETISNTSNNGHHNADTGMNINSLDVFLDRVKTSTLAVSGMAFQDAWTLDLDRLRECNVLVFNPDGRLIPFCAYNLTSKNGYSLYRKHEVKIKL